ncbi:hypothetical protein HYFRA_00002122 [Hymenoscyphus fraxineus]|uniref:Cytochrome P450 n=1 Tax=Hymenoscyphus fraxineus TaxID=746836 RepID=A0A9N9PED4_9HELO|nr:hypothetical protein HYFRA_00002122 [Hymenoscyphus fraxineus]
MDQIYLAVGLFSFCGILAWRYYSNRKKSPYPLPPGPPADPIIGSMRYMPTERPELAYIEWGKKYNSDILYINVLGQSMVILNKREDAVELLDRRGAKYMDRPPLPYFDELGFEGMVTSANNGPYFRRHRKAFQNGFTNTKCIQYQPLEENEARQLAMRLITDSESWMAQMVTFSTAIIANLAYGIEVNGKDDDFVKWSEGVGRGVGGGASASATMVDIFPIIRNLPQWLSIFPSLKLARECRPYVKNIHEKPFDIVKDDMEKGIQKISFIRSLLEERASGKVKPADQLNDYDITSIGGTTYAAGMDTTWSTTSIFVLGMILNPDAQRKAQQEIDAVVGTDRLPTFADRAKLPAVERIVLETFRYNPVLPLNIPHKSTVDDVFKGYFIPKGYIYLNRDTSTYSSPELFNPDRYIPVSEGGEGAIPPVGHFGFGRRICPGQNLGLNNVWIAVATTLATINIQKKKDKNGSEIEPVVEMTTGFVSHPKYFPVDFQPRSERAVELLKKL